MEQNTHKTIGVALSGGGHRATIFALGALLYLVDSGRNKDVTMITSVSGGSITNAFLATLPKPFNKISIEEFEPEVAKFSHQIAGNKKWELTSILSYFGLLIAWLTFTLPNFPHALFSLEQCYFFALLLVWATLIGPQSGGTLFNWWGTWLYLGLLVPLIITAIALWWHEVPLTWWQWIGLILAIGISLYYRYKIAEYAYDTIIKEHARRNISAMANNTIGTFTLDQMPNDIRHVFCTTDVLSGEHVYFSNDLIFIPYIGIGKSTGIPMRVAVEASANFPIGFPYRLFVRPPEHQFKYFKDDKKPRLFALTDGGVYDNIGLSWYTKIQELATANEDIGKFPDELFIVNSSVSDPSEPKSIFTLFIPLLGELFQLLKLPGILYENHAVQQAQDLQRQFLSERNRQNTNGIVVSIDHPAEGLSLRLRDDVQAYANLPMHIDDLDYLKKRAKCARVLLKHELDTKRLNEENEKKKALERELEAARSELTKLSDEDELARYKLEHRIFELTHIEIQKITDHYNSAFIDQKMGYIWRNKDMFAALRSRHIATTLRPLGELITSRLLWHGYNTAMHNACVLLDDFPVMLPEQNQEIFDRFVDGKLRSGRPKPTLF